MVKFIGLVAWRIIEPFLGVFLLIPLALAWIVLMVVLFFMQAWKDAHA